MGRRSQTAAPAAKRRSRATWLLDATSGPRSWFSERAAASWARQDGHWFDRSRRRVSSRPERLSLILQTQARYRRRSGGRSGGSRRICLLWLGRRNTASNRSSFADYPEDAANDPPEPDHALTVDHDQVSRREIAAGCAFRGARRRLRVCRSF